MYKGIVFDLDGTLVDSPLCFDSIRRELEIPAGEFILEYLETLPQSERAYKQKRLVEIELEAAKKAEPFPDVHALLDEIHQKKIEAGIFTRNCHVATHHILEILKIKVKMVITRDDAPAKPNPIGLLRFLENWKIPGNQLLYVGDFKFDIECGKKAGVRTALFTNGKPAPVDGLTADHIVPHYRTFWQNIV